MRIGIPILVLIMTIVVAASCSRPPHVAGGSGQPSSVVQEVHANAADAADLSDPNSFADARRGFVAAPEGHISDLQGKVIRDFDAFGFLQGEAPATVHPSLWRQALLNNHVGLFKVSERIWQVRGFDLANMTLIEGDSGFIVIDALTARETATAALAFARQHLGDRPVTALVYTHSHADHFGGALGILSPEDVQARQLPVVAPAGFLEEATSENVLMGTAMVRRAAYMYGNRLPISAEGLVDTGLGKSVAFGRVGMLPPNDIIQGSGEERLLDGVRFVFHNVPGAEAPAEFTFSLPDLHAYCGAELMSHTMHNLYTLRGAKVRDALKWASYLDEALEHAAGAEVVFNQHHWPVWGQDRISEFVERQRDTYKFIHDQTVRRMNAGMTASEIADTLTLPKALQDYLNVRGYYGTVRHNVQAVYQFYLGWFDAHPANLDPYPPAAIGQRYVDAMGGPEVVLAKAQTAFDAGDYRWASELLKHAVHANADNSAARELMAKSFEQLGYASESSTWRNFYLTGALELRQGGPEIGMDRAAMIDLLQHTPSERFLEAMAASLNAEKAEDLELTINLVFADQNESFVLRLANGVLHHRRHAPDPAANATLTLSKAFFLRMITGSAGAADLLTSDDVDIEGSAIDLGRFLRLIDKAPGTFPIVTR
ncbi:MAG: Metallo-beta-lactamase superfamily protein [Alphaproteobacteria bacterium ADurb.BinA280]|jgi:alkyl sulfatase BDS1-like metallo-beta-lactamase superfamily hydrolase|nr:MAG: Metallo-beta-lactamase superfamily protein [Alphaproteobacteria bacterium ADurb.BinA280]